jgi:hypothetical protein
MTMHAVFRRSTSDDHGRMKAHRDSTHLATMTLSPNESNQLCLKPQQCLRLSDALGWRVVAEVGAIWITQDDDSRDVVLHAGESFVLDRNGVALITPLGQAEIRLDYSRKGEVDREMRHWPSPSLRTA